MKRETTCLTNTLNPGCQPGCRVESPMPSVFPNTQIYVAQRYFKGVTFLCLQLHSVYSQSLSSEAFLSSSKGISGLASSKEMKDVCWKGIPCLIYEVALGSLCFLLCLPSRHFVIELAAANHLSSKQDQLPNSSNDRGFVRFESQQLPLICCRHTWHLYRSATFRL